MEGLLVAFGVVLVAELGDKSQLLALSLASRRPTAEVVAGLVLATAVLMAASVAVGAALAASLPVEALRMAAGVAFLAFGVWALRPPAPEGDGDVSSHSGVPAGTRSGRSSRGVLGVAIVFGLAEVGDKTMLAAVTLAATHGAVATWAGATAGMSLAAGAAAVAGGWLGTRLPERALRLVSAALFAAVGLWLLAEGIRR